MFTIEAIVDMLDRHHQQATYSAVAELLGRPSRSLMSECPKNQRHSWIVSQKNGMPTGYSDFQKHPSLTENPEVLTARDELIAWLRTHDSHPVDS